VKTGGPIPKKGGVLGGGEDQSHRGGVGSSSMDVGDGGLLNPGGIHPGKECKKEKR